MTALRRLAAVLVVLGALGACSSGSNLTASSGGDDGAPPATSFSGDVDSPFCLLSRRHGAAPAQDPFEADLRPDEIELRLLRIRDRMAALEEVAPDDLAPDIAELRGGFDDLVAALDAVDYDLVALAGSDADLSVVDDPRFAAISERVSTYQTEVCHLDA